MTDFVAPETKIEELLASMWKDILETDRIGVHDDFFDLGGTSLAFVRMFVNVIEEFGIHVDISLITEATNIASLAQLIEHNVHGA